MTLKTEGAVRSDARRYSRRLALPVTAVLLVFGLWTQLAYGTHWTWLVLGFAVVCQLSVVMLVYTDGGDGLAFSSTTAVVIAVVVLIFGCLYPNLIPSTLDPAWSLTIYNASSSAYTLKIMTWAAVLVTPLVLVYQGWTYWVFRQRISAERIPDPTGLSPRIP